MRRHCNGTADERLPFCDEKDRYCVAAANLDTYFQEYPPDASLCLDVIQQAVEYLKEREREHSLVEIDEMCMEGDCLVQVVNGVVRAEVFLLLPLCTLEEAVRSLKKFCTRLLALAKPSQLNDDLGDAVKKCMDWDDFTQLALMKERDKNDGVAPSQMIVSAEPLTSSDESDILEITEVDCSASSETPRKNIPRDVIRSNFIEYTERAAIGEIETVSTVQSYQPAEEWHSVKRQCLTAVETDQQSPMTDPTTIRHATNSSAYNLRARQNEKMRSFSDAIRANGIQLEKLVWIEDSQRMNEFIYQQLLKPYCGNDTERSKGDPYNVLRTGCQYEVCITSWNLAKELGLGVLAMEPIPAAESVFEYTGDILTNAEAEQRQALHGTKYMYDLDDEEEIGFNGRALPRAIDAHFSGNVARFLNHSCDPNLKIIKTASLMNFCIQKYQTQRLIFVTQRFIHAGEYLTVDYCPRFDSTQDEQSRVKDVCRCGAINCRGWLAP